MTLWDLINFLTGAGALAGAIETGVFLGGGLARIAIGAIVGIVCAPLLMAVPRWTSTRLGRFRLGRNVGEGVLLVVYLMAGAWALAGVFVAYGVTRAMISLMLR